MSSLPLVAGATPEQYVHMFSAHCPTHGRRVLLGVEHITAIHNGPDGITVAFRCSCGGRGTFVTGRRPVATTDASDTTLDADPQAA